MATKRWTREELERAGVSPAKLARLLRKFEECVRLMAEMGLSVYASDGSGYLIHSSRPEHDRAGKSDFGAIVADIGTGFDGGGW